MREQLVTHDDKIYDGTNGCTSITVHETANESIGADAQAHADLQSTGNVRSASWHITADDTEAIRSYPDTAQCWHAGTDEGNRNSLAVEICVNADGDYKKAFKNAAEVVRAWRIKHNLTRADVKQHHAWTGKDCPAKMRLANRWEEFLNLTEPNQKEVKPMAQMVSPFEGRLTQNHGDSGGYKGHKGMDISPPKPGQTGRPVYAAFAGTVRKVYGTAINGGKTSTWATGRTGNGLLISNPDGEGNGYNHVKPLSSIRVGDKVEAGDLLGYNDRSGNQTAPHLHFELWADWKNSNSDYDPALAFNKFGVKPGSAPVKTGTVTPVASKPSTARPTPAKNTADGNSKSDFVAIANALNAMGLDAGFPDGVNGPMLKGAVKAYQEHHGLRPDGNWGPVTQAKFEQVKAVQRALKSEGYTKQTIDGYDGAQTAANIKDYQKRVGLVADGVAGPKTLKKLGV